MSLSIAFTEPTFQRVVPLAVGAILALGRRTVTGMLRPVGDLLRGHSSDYHRVFSRAAWSLWPLGRVLAEAVLRWLPPDKPVVLIADDTTAQHRGKRVYGKGRHYDAVRSTFQELRAHLGLETPRQHVAKSVLRTGPCLFGLFSLVSLIFAEHARHHAVRPRTAAWYAKTEPSFSDALATVRRQFWLDTILKGSPHGKAFTKLPPQVRNLLLDHLTLAA